jgi:hypothetical protein
MLRSVHFLLIASIGLLQTAPVGAQSSLTLNSPLVYGDASLEALQAHQTKVAAEASAMQTRLDNGLVFEDVVDPDFGQEIFNVDANDTLHDHLQQRLDALKAEGQQDSGPLDQVKKTLASTMLKWSNCQGPENCDALKKEMERLKHEQDQLKEFAAARMTTAQAESDLIRLQQNVLKSALSIAYRRAKRGPAGLKQSPRRTQPERLTPALRRLFETERRVHGSNLETLNKLCKDVESAFARSKTRDAQTQSQDTAATQSRDDLQGQEDKQLALVQDLLERRRHGDEVTDAIDAIHAALLTDLDDSLAQVQPLQQAAQDADQALTQAQEALRDGQTALKQLQTETADVPNPCPLQANQRMQAVVDDAAGTHAGAGLALRVATVDSLAANVQLLESAVRLAQTNRDNNALQTDAIRARIRLVLPVLSPEYAASIFAYDAEFLRRFWDNLGAVAATIQEHGLHRLDQLKRLPTTLTSWRGVGTVLGTVFWLVVLLIVGRRVIHGSDAAQLLVWEWLSSRRWMQPVLGLLHPLFKLISVVARPLLVLALAAAVRWYLGENEPEVAAGFAIILWIIVYKIGVHIARTLTVGPPWTPQRRRVLSPAFDPSPILQQSEDVRSTSAQSLTWAVQYFIVKLAVLTSVAQLFGQGYLYHLLADVFALLLWLLLLGLVVIWRSRVAQAYLAVAPQATRGFVRRNIEKPWLIVLVLPMAAVMVFLRVLPWLRALFGKSGTLAKLSVFFTRRRMEQIARDKEAERGGERSDLPADYTSHFELRPLTQESYRVPTDDPVRSVADQFTTWTSNKRDGSVAIVGESGMGKTTLVNQLLTALPVPADQVLRSELTDKLTTEEDVIAFLAQTFGFAETPDSLGALEQAILDDPSPVVVLDNAHHFFLKSMGGMEGLEAFLHVVNMTCTNVFWITTFNAYSWYFVTNLKRSEPPFRQIVHLKAWSAEAIQDLILKRNRESGYAATFQDLIVDRGVDDRTHYEVVRTKHSYFRILSDLSRGNPSVALRHWLRSLRGCDDNSRTLRVGLYQPEPPSALTDASDDVLFALTAIATHESISVDELAKVLRVPEDAAQRTVNYCEENVLVHREGEIVMLHLRNYSQIIRHLEMRSFIYF